MLCVACAARAVPIYHRRGERDLFILIWICVLCVRRSEIAFYNFISRRYMRPSAISYYMFVYVSAAPLIGITHPYGLMRTRIHICKPVITICAPQNPTRDFQFVYTHTHTYTFFTRAQNYRRRRTISHRRAIQIWE